MAQVGGENVGRGCRFLILKIEMASQSNAAQELTGYPRCDACGRSVRIRGINSRNVLCKHCISGALPFAGIESEGEFRGALREYREGLGSRATDFQGLRFDPFADEEREALRHLNRTLQGCKYAGGDEIINHLKTVSKSGGCSLSALFHNIRSARGPGLEMLEAEIRRWGVTWDLIGLAETWLDAESEKLLSFQGYNIVCASRKKKSGGGVALMIKEGLVFRERADLSVFEEGEIESLFVEIVRDRGQRNELIGVVYRPPSGDVAAFTEHMSSIMDKMGNKSAFIMGDFNVDLLKSGSHRPTTDFLEGW